MGQVLHGCATTTEAIRRATQHRQESLKSLSKRYGIDTKTVAKWKKHSFATDLPTGPKAASRRCCRLKLKPSSLRSAGTRCCRSTIDSMPCRRLFRISADHRCIAACGATVFLRCRMWKAARLPHASSTMLRGSSAWIWALLVLV
jgi:hypothetical protein